jgi:hypothetical protein
MLKTLEHNEHAGHIAHGSGDHGGHEHGAAPHGAAKSKFSSNMAALLVVTLAASLALTEQGAKQAEIKVQANLIAATDAWAQYQAKSTRSTVSRDVVSLIGALDTPSTPEVADRRKKVVDAMNADRERFDNDPNDGREAISHRAHEFEHERDHALEQTHAFHNGAAMMELGIVLSTASAIVGSRLMMGAAVCLGVLGGLCALAGVYHPEWGAF